MNILENSSLDIIVKEHMMFLSKVIGKEITSLEIQKTPFIKGLETFNHTLKFALDNKYIIELMDTLECSQEHPFWKDKCKLSIHDKDNALYYNESNHYTNIKNHPIKYIEESDLTNEINNKIISNIGTIHVDAPHLYDYESLNIEDIKKQSFNNISIYRIMFALMKNEGRLLPPILIKEPIIMEMMENGDVKKLDDILLGKINSLGREFEQFAFDHMMFEREKILEYANQRKKYFNKALPLAIKIPEVDKVIIPGDSYKDQINILVVEDFDSPNNNDGSINILAEKLSVDLAKTRMYDGVTIYRSLNIYECIKICDTGQIDMIVLDGKNDDLNKILSELGDGLSLNIVQDGKNISPKMFKDINNKEMWVKAIYASLEEKDMTKPPYIILPVNFMDIDLSVLINGMLPTINTFSKEEELYSSKHIKELSDAYNLETDIDRIYEDKSISKSASSINRDKYTRAMQKIIVNEQLECLEEASQMGKNLSKKDFENVFHSFISQNISQNFEHTTPSSLMEGLHRMDLVFDRYKNYFKEENIRSRLNYELGFRISTCETQLEDSAFFTNDAHNWIRLGNLVGNTYILLKKMNETYNEEYEDFCKNSGVSILLGNKSVTEVIDNIIRYSMNIAKSLDMKNSFENKNISGFLLEYSRRIAEISNSVLSYENYYKEMFNQK